MPVNETRRGARNYGFAVGIIQRDCSLPFIAGDVDNASTYRYPVIYSAVPGLSIARVDRTSPLRIAGTREWTAPVAYRASFQRRSSTRNDDGFQPQRRAAHAGGPGHALCT